MRQEIQMKNNQTYSGAIVLNNSLKMKEKDVYNMASRVR